MIISLISLVTGSITGTVLFLKGFKSYRKWKLINDTPTSRISDIKEGTVEVKGNISTIPGKVLNAPISGEPCIRYHIRVLKYTTGVNDGKWEIVLEEKNEVPFLLTDDSGSVVVDGKGADLKMVSSFFQERSIFGNLDLTAKDFIKLRNIDEKGVIGIMNRDLKVEEKIVPPQGLLYVLGNAKDQGKLTELANNYLVNRFTIAKDKKMILSFDDEDYISKNNISGAIIFFILGSISLITGIALATIFW